MLSQLNSELEYSKEVLNLRAYRQEVLASNIANAETPNYKALDFNFANELNSILLKKNFKILPLQQSSEKHLKKNVNFETFDSKISKIYSSEPDNINHNNVNMNKERMKFVDNEIRYQISIAIINNYIKNITHVLEG